MLAWLVRELWSTLRLMSCTPWQSLQDGATISPILSERLAVDAVLVVSRRCARSIRYAAISFGSLWHWAQVWGRLSLKTGESSCLTGTISWALPWQLTQVAAPDAPMAWLIPWMLVA